ncbi:hypothetical protein SEVIR_5G429801v4 [Setaria viridis]
MHARQSLHQITAPLARDRHQFGSRNRRWPLADHGAISPAAMILSVRRPQLPLASRGAQHYLSETGLTDIAECRSRVSATRSKSRRASLSVIIVLNWKSHKIYMLGFGLVRRAAITRNHSRSTAPTVKPSHHLQLEWANCYCN